MRVTPILSVTVNHFHHCQKFVGKAWSLDLLLSHERGYTVGCCIECKYYSRLEVIDSNKHYSFLRY
jgi:hypothetical protein